VGGQPTNQPAETSAEEGSCRVFIKARATFGNDDIRFLLGEWDGDKKPRFFKGPDWFLSLLSIPIKYVIGIEIPGRGVRETRRAGDG
jgi:hypothetical protein